MTQDLWKRVQSRIGQTAIDRLHAATIGVVGLGSLGSWSTLQLAMSGVGGYVLVDPDVLEDHNVVRHAADLRYVGRPKVAAMQDLILQRNPQARVVTIQGDAREHSEALHGMDLVVVAGLGSEIAQSEMGEILRAMKVPFLVGGLYERAIAGEVLYVNPNSEQSPCYACFASLLRDTQPNLDATPIDYGLPLDEVKAQPGLGIHVIRVATVLSDWAIRILVDDQSVLEPYAANLCIIANERYEMGEDEWGNPIVLHPATSWWTTVERQPDCRFCGRQVETPHKTLDELLSE